ncbi:helix-turn-helix transcriptional regulator [Spirillospora sp. NPDC052269]
MPTKPLSPATRLGLQVASVLGRPFTTQELDGLTGIGPDGVGALVDEAVDAGILVVADGLVDFRHDPVRQAFSESLPVAVRRSLRRRMVDVRLAQGASARDVAADLAETALPGDHRAVGLLREAAEGRADTAPSEALAWSRAALRVAGPPGPHTAEIVGEIVESLGRTGEYAEAKGLADTTLKGSLAPGVEAGLRARVARLVGHRSFAEAVRQSRIGLSLADLSEVSRDRLTAAQALHLAQAGETAEAVAAGRPANGPDAEAGAAALTALAMVELSRLNLEHAFDLHERADARAADLGVSRRPWGPEVCGRAFVLAASGRLGVALQEADEGVRTARETGHAVTALAWSMTRARILLDTGRLAAARAEADAVLTSAGVLGTGDFADVTARFALGRVAVHMGERDGITRSLADGMRMTRTGTPVVRRTGAWLAALASDALGDTARAAEMIKLAWPDGLDVMPGALPDPADLVVLVRLAERAGLPGLATAAAARAAGLDPGCAVLRGVAAHARGIVEDDPDLLLHAAKLFEDTERPLLRASAAEGAGRVLGASGDPAARDVLDTALDLYEEAGAARDAARVRRRLRLLGVRRTSRSGEASEDGRWGLTAAELKVARLVAQGATNRQIAEQLFVSRHTINTHVRSIFTKWDINSRVDLARLLLAREAR